MNQENDQRADRALNAVYENTAYNQEPPDTLQIYIGDLLANLMHLCQREAIDFNLCLQNAQMHYRGEKDAK